MLDNASIMLYCIIARIENTVATSAASTAPTVFLTNILEDFQERDAIPTCNTGDARGNGV